MNANGDCIRCFTRHFCNFTGSESLDKALMQNVSIGCLHRVDFLEPLLGIEAVVRRVPWVDGRFKARFEHMIERSLSLFTCVIDKQVVCDPVQECSYVRDFFCSLQEVPVAQECFLRQILADIVIVAFPDAVTGYFPVVQVVVGVEVLVHGEEKDTQGNASRCRHYSRYCGKKLYGALIHLSLHVEFHLGLGLWRER